MQHENTSHHATGPAPLRWREWLQVGVLAALAAYFAYTLLSGNIRHYIAARFVWLVWIAVGALLLMAATRAAALISGERALAYGHDHDHHAHSHAPTPARRVGAWLSLGIVALPVVLGVLVPSQPLASDAVENPVTGDLGGVEVGATAGLRADPLERNVLDWVRVLSAATDPASVAGQPADVVGFVYRDPRFDPASQFLVTRFTVSCCVADAQPVGMVVFAPDAGPLPEDSWVRVRGTMQVRPFDGAPVAVLVAEPDGVTVVDQPEHPYLYP